MTDEQMRIAIADACGIVVYEEPDGSGLWSCKGSYKTGISKEHAQRVSLPDYLNNLNAMHQAEKVFSAEQLTDYGIELSKVVPCGWDAQVHWGKLAHATARQRCIAFLKTLNLWKD